MPCAVMKNIWALEPNGSALKVCASPYLEAKLLRLAKPQFLHL